MGKPAQFPTHTISDVHHEEMVDQRVDRLIAPLAEGKGKLVFILIPHHEAFASSSTYRTESGTRQLFVITEGSDVIAYMDLDLDHRKHLAVCEASRSSETPTRFGNLNALNPSGDGFACSDDEVGKLLVGLTIYALRREGVTSLEIVEYKPKEKAEDAFSSAGTQRADFQSRTYSGVSNEIRHLVAASLRISVDQAE